MQIYYLIQVSQITGRYKNIMSKENKTGIFRLRMTEEGTGKQLISIRFTKTGFFVAAVSVSVMLCAAIFSVIAFTPVRTFIPGYPDARTKRAAIQNAIRMDSLETVIYRWELYAENLRRAVDGMEPVDIDRMLSSRKESGKEEADPAYLRNRDSLLREEVKKEEMFDISTRRKRELPIEGMLFFTPLKGVVSQGYDPVLHPFIDVTAPAGSVIKAVADGTVIYDGWSEDTGYTIQIQHGSNIISIYKHNQKILKKTGDKVSAGAPIALVGNTGKLTTGDHLHFELWYRGESVDPTKYINF